MAMEKERNKADQEKARMYIQYLSNVFSQPLQEKPKPEFLRAKKEFEEMLMPTPQKGEVQGKTYEWDFDPSEFVEANEVIELNE